MKTWRERNLKKVRAQARAYYHRNKERVLDAQRERVAKNPWMHRTRDYEITSEQCEEMFREQKQSCATCHAALSHTAPSKKFRPHIDHDHETNRVRAILCAGCNMALGQVNDRPDLLRKLADYLERHGK